MGDVKERVEKKEAVQPTYDELKNYCNQLLAQRNQIANELNQVNSIVNKLPWLFKVVENQEAFNSTFVKSCIDEIEYIMTPPKEEEPTEKN